MSERDSAAVQIRRARPEDAPEVARLLHAFNTEFDEPTPAAEVLAERGRRMLAGGEMTVLLAGEPPFGLAMLRFRPSIWSESLDAYLEELYVEPQRRGAGAGRRLLEAAMAAAREEGAGHIDLGTAEEDRAARALYESCGFTNREGSPDGPVMLYYEREL